MKRLIVLCALLFLSSPIVIFAQGDNTVKIYIAPQIGSGTFEDPFRSKINTYIDVSLGESFDEIDNPARLYSICFVTARPATHATITADSEIVSLIQQDVTPAQLASKLDMLVSDLPSAFKNNVKNALEARGISFAWVGASNTVRDVFRYLLRVHFFSQEASGLNSWNFIKQFILSNLTAQISSMDPAVVNIVKNWMASKGLDYSWVSGTTTVRQVLHYIVENRGFGPIKIGGHSF